MKSLQESKVQSPAEHREKLKSDLKRLQTNIEKVEKHRKFITLLVVGPSRAGKSTFVNTLA